MSAIAVAAAFLGSLQLAAAQPPPGCRFEAADPCSLDGTDANYIETVHANSGERRIYGEGCPNNNPVEVCVGDNPRPASKQGWDFRMPASPRFNSRDYETSLANAHSLAETGGFVGITANGVDILSCYAGSAYGRCVDYNTSATALEGDTFEYCGGHGNPYHYHQHAPCLLQQMGATSTAPSPQIGWVADGFPLMGNRGPGGVLMQQCGSAGAHPTICVDRCGGLYGEQDSDDFLYRYYLMGPDGDVETTPVSPAPGSEFFPFSPYCLLGCGEMSVTSRANETRNPITLPSCGSGASDGTKGSFSPQAAILAPVTASYSPIPASEYWS